MQFLVGSLAVYACLYGNIVSSSNNEASFSRLNNNDSAESEVVEIFSVNGSTSNGKKILSFPLLPHHEVQARRLRELGLVEDEVEMNDFDARNLEEERTYHPVGTLYQGYGTHYVDLWVGTPNPQRQTVIVDTGSSITAFPCEGCKDCGQGNHVDLFYPYSKSESFSLVECGSCDAGICEQKLDSHRCMLSMSYQEGSSWNAFESRDTVYFGGSHLVPLVKNRILPEENTADKESKNDTATNEDGNSEIKSSQELAKPILDKSPEEKIKKDEETKVKKEAEKTEAVNELEEVFENNEMANHAKEYSFPLKFGCQYSITGLFKTQLADGIMGMENSQNSFWRQMHKAKMIDEEKFSLCYGKSNTSRKEGSFAGVITLGGANTELHSSPMIYAHNLKKEGWFTVYIRAMYLSSNLGTGDVLKLQADYKKVNKEGIIVDSGTTDSYLPQEFKSHFRKAFDQLSEMPLKSDFKGLSEEDVSKFPSLLIQLSEAANVSEEELKNEDGTFIHRLAKELDPSHPNDVILAVPPTHYFEYLQSSDKWENRLHMTESSGGVIGANLMIGHDILFDTEKQRIGFAESDCNFAKLTSEASV